jgi:hypothetical protein
MVIMLIFALPGLLIGLTGSEVVVSDTPEYRLTYDHDRVTRRDGGVTLVLQFELKGDRGQVGEFDVEMNCAAQTVVWSEMHLLDESGRRIAAGGIRIMNAPEPVHDTDRLADIYRRNCPGGVLSPPPFIPSPVPVDRRHNR